MDVGLILLQTFLAIFGTIKDSFIKNPKIRTFFVVAIIVAIGVTAWFQIITQQKEDFKNQYTGVLTSFADATATNPGLIVGNGAVLNWGGGASTPAISWGEGDGISLSLIGGKINVSVPIRNSDGDEIGQIVNNVWTIYSPQLIQDRNFNANSLEIKDLKGNVTFQIQIIGSEVHLAGCFYTEDATGTTFSLSSWLDKELFLYPSINYPGELNPNATSSDLPPGGSMGIDKTGKCLFAPPQ